MEGENYEGGCEGNYVRKFISIAVALVMVLFVWYLWCYLRDQRILSERMCGNDQHCPCAGNETFTGNDNSLTKIMTGR